MTSPNDFEHLQVRRFVPASPERVFDAWTDPTDVKEWWGPKGVACLSAEFDLRVGGAYRIENELPDGNVLWITGTFESIERPHLLIYTWVVENQSPATERVKVQFDRRDLGTDLVITHARIATKALSKQHQQGWDGCLNGLVGYLSEAGRRRPS